MFVPEHVGHLESSGWLLFALVILTSPEWRGRLLRSGLICSPIAFPGLPQGLWSWHMVPSLTFTPWSLQSWIFRCSCGCTCTGYLFRDSAFTIQCCSPWPHQAFTWATLEWFFIHDQVGLPTWKPVSIPSGPQLLCAVPKEILPDFIVLSDVSLFLTIADSSPPANQLSVVLVEPKLHFSGDGLLLITADSSASIGSEPQILNSKYYTNGSGSLDFFWNFTSQASNR